MYKTISIRQKYFYYNKYYMEVILDKNKLHHYKKLLLKEKEKSLRTLELKDKNQQNGSLKDYINELSMYDNHPADIATETFQAEMDMNLETDEKIHLEKINQALKMINEGTYGKCIVCGKNISEDRLETLPSSIKCIDCKRKSNPIDDMLTTRPAEEAVLRSIYKGSTDDEDNKNIFDQEDSWQDAAKFNRTKETNKALDWYDNNMYGEDYPKDV